MYYLLILIPFFCYKLFMYRSLLLANWVFIYNLLCSWYVKYKKKSYFLSIKCIVYHLIKQFYCSNVQRRTFLIKICFILKIITSFYWVIMCEYEWLLHVFKCFPFRFVGGLWFNLFVLIKFADWSVVMIWYLPKKKEENKIFKFKI